jgi:phosphoglycerate dehydrogenase-like enzyme
MLAGRVCGIFGFGGIGAAAARLMHGIGMRVHAINRRGRTDQHVDWIGTPERLNELLEAADVLLISVPLTRATYGLIGAAELRRMKDAILINLARGEIVQERALYASPCAELCGEAATESSALINRFLICRTSSRTGSTHQASMQAVKFGCMTK